MKEFHNIDDLIDYLETGEEPKKPEPVVEERDKLKPARGVFVGIMSGFVVWAAFLWWVLQ